MPRGLSLEEGGRLPSHCYECLNIRQQPFLMLTELFAISGRSLEGNGQLPTIHENLATDFTSVFALGQDVQQCCLSSSRRAHQGSKRAGLAPAGHLVQEIELLAAGLDRVRKMSPLVWTRVSTTYLNVVTFGLLTVKTVLLECTSPFDWRPLSPATLLSVASSSSRGLLP